MAFSHALSINRKAVNAETGDQVTQYIHGTTLASSGIATSHLLSQVKRPNGSGLFYGEYHGVHRSEAILKR